jgi:acetyl-CoA carboxylase biotin carboxyl carrier protein
MADDASSPSESFNLDKLKELIQLMETHGLTEVELSGATEQWKLKRGGHEQVVYAAPQVVPQAVAAAQAVAPQATAAAPAAPAASSLPVIKSPTVGTFYTAPTPEDPAFVEIGARVQPDTVVCIVEAMKVFNQITADCSGTIAEILVKNGDPVEFGQPLFRVQPG